MFPEELLVKITEETNSYAQKILEQKPDPKWHDTTIEEMKAYIADNIVMGVTTAPEKSMYFSKDDLFRPGGINKKFARDRLEKLDQYFHLADVSTNPSRNQPGHDRLARVRPMTKTLIDNFRI